MHHQIMLKAMESWKALRNSILYNFAIPSILRQTVIPRLENLNEKVTVYVWPDGF